MIRAGIDIGAHSLRLILEEEGLVFDEPALAAFNARGDLLAIGSKALDLRGQGSDEIRVASWIENGEVDFDVLEAMLNELCYEFRLFRMFQKTVLLICYPTVLDEETIEYLKDSLLGLGASEIYFDQEIWIAAIGSGLDLYLPVSTSVLNIGSSNCDIAVFLDGQIRFRQSGLALGGLQAAALVEDALLCKDNLLVSSQTIDQIIQTIGCVRMQNQPLAMEVRGVDASSGLLRTVSLSENDITPILMPLARQIGSWTAGFLDSLDGALTRDICERGIIASGGVMKIKGLSDVISMMADCPVYVTDEPDRTVAQGLHALIAQLK